MSARRLGRLLGSALAVAALVGGIFAAEPAESITTADFDWGAPAAMLHSSAPEAAVWAV